MVTVWGIINSDYLSIWNTQIPLKIKNFLWLVKRNRVLTKVNLKKKKEVRIGQHFVFSVQIMNLLIIYLLHVHISMQFGNGLQDIIILLSQGLLCKTYGILILLFLLKILLMLRWLEELFYG
jgi:zinc-binding in reverse transcriptase